MRPRMLLFLSASLIVRGAQVTVSTPLGQVRSTAVDPGGYVYVAGANPSVPPTPGAVNTGMAKDTAFYCQGPQPPPCSTAFIAKLDAATMKSRLPDPQRDPDFTNAGGRTTLVTGRSGSPIGDAESELRLGIPSLSLKYGGAPSFWRHL